MLTMRVDVDVSTNETTEMMPPLPPLSWLKKTEAYCEKFRKHCNKDHRDEEHPFFECQDEMHEQIDILQQMDPWMRNAPKSLPLVKGCSSVNFTACSVSEAGAVPTLAIQDTTVRYLQRRRTIE